MKTTFELNGRTLFVRLSEDLDHHNAEYIRVQSDQYVEKYPVNRIVFDFTGVEFMDSSGIGVIMGRYKQMQYAGGEVLVYGIKKQDHGQEIGMKIVGDFNDVNEVRSLCVKRLPKHQVPSSIQLVDKLPRTISGKIMRGEKNGRT